MRNQPCYYKIIFLKNYGYRSEQSGLDQTAFMVFVWNFSERNKCISALCSALESELMLLESS